MTLTILAVVGIVLAICFAGFVIIEFSGSRMHNCVFGGLLLSAIVTASFLIAFVIAPGECVGRREFSLGSDKFGAGLKGSVCIARAPSRLQKLFRGQQ